MPENIVLQFTFFNKVYALLLLESSTLTCIIATKSLCTGGITDNISKVYIKGCHVKPTQSPQSCALEHMAMKSHISSTYIQFVPEVVGQQRMLPSFQRIF